MILLLICCGQILEDDSEFLINIFEEYLKSEVFPIDSNTESYRNDNIMFTEQYYKDIQKEHYGNGKPSYRPFVAELALHSIHEPHPALPEFYNRYETDPDYTGYLI